MKKWILIIVLAVALIAAVILASQSQADFGGTTPSDDPGTTGSSGTEESTGTIELKLTYEEYQAMSGPERQEWLESFPTMDDFLAWLNAAKSQYEAEQATRETINGNDPINIGDLINGNKSN